MSNIIWLLIGAFLVIVELFLPGVFLIWFGLAAIVTAGIVWVFPMALEIQLIVMAVLSLIFLLVGRKIYKKIGDTHDASQEPLNQRTARYIGNIAHTQGAIIDGRGRVKIEDSSWLCECQTDLPENSRVKIIGANGTVLIVEPA